MSYDWQPKVPKLTWERARAFSLAYLGVHRLPHGLRRELQPLIGLRIPEHHLLPRVLNPYRKRWMGL